MTASGLLAMQSALPSLAIVLFLLSTLAAFAVRCALRGRPRTPYVEERPPSMLLARWLQEWWIWLWGPVERACIWLGLPPNAISITSSAVIVAAAFAIGQGSLSAGGWLYLAGASLDIVDGRVARATGQSSRAGAFLDSTLDRVAELAVFAGLAIWYRDSPILYSALAAGASSILVSYARARGEALGVRGEAKVGGMQRAERIVVAGVACALSPIADWLAGEEAGRTVVGTALTILAVLTTGSAARRIASIFRALHASEPQVKPGAVRLLKSGGHRDVIR